jgi:hypothetical protein
MISVQATAHSILLFDSNRVKSWHCDLYRHLHDNAQFHSSQNATGFRLLVNLFSKFVPPRNGALICRELKIRVRIAKSSHDFERDSRVRIWAFTQISFNRRRLEWVRLQRSTDWICRSVFTERMMLINTNLPMTLRRSRGGVEVWKFVLLRAARVQCGYFGL